MNTAKNLLLFFFVLDASLCFAQKIDTTYYQNKNIRSIQEWNVTKDTVHIRGWYPGGEKMSDIYCHVKKGSYTPIKHSVVYYPNGSIFQEYTEVIKTDPPLIDGDGSRMDLKTFDEKGMVIDNWSCNVLENIIVHSEYYMNGNKQKFTVANMPYDNKGVYTGLVLSSLSSDLKFSLPKALDGVSYMYQQQSMTPLEITEYHGNGKQMHLWKFEFLAGGGGYWVHTLYDTTGVVDPATTYQSPDPKQPYYPVKQGAWYSYYKNGQLEKKEHYVNDGLNGEQWYWHKNGQLRKHYNTSDTFDQIIEYDENGKKLN